MYLGLVGALGDWWGFVKSRLWFYFVCCLFVCCFVGCLSDRLELTEDSVGKAHSFKKGEVFRIALRGSSPTMMWNLGSFDKAVLESKGAKWEHIGGSTGGLQPGVQNYSFEAKKAGKTTIVFYNPSGLYDYEVAKKMDGFEELVFEIVVGE